MGIFHHRTCGIQLRRFATNQEKLGIQNMEVVVERAAQTRGDVALENLGESSKETHGGKYGIFQPKTWPWLWNKVGSHVQEDGIGCGASWTRCFYAWTGGILGNPTQTTRPWRFVDHQFLIDHHFFPLLYQVLSGLSGIFFLMVPSIHLSVSLSLSLFLSVSINQFIKRITYLHLFTDLSVYWFIYLLIYLVV